MRTRSKFRQNHTSKTFTFNIDETILSIYPARAKGLRAESARAVTGRWCPHSGEGEDFLMRLPSFLTKTTVTRKRKVKKSISRCKMNSLSEGYKRAVDKTEIFGQNCIFSCLAPNWSHTS